FDTLYNNLTVQREGTRVELRARSRRGEFYESVVDVADPLNLILEYSRTVYAAAFFQPEPKRALIIGLGGAGVHRLFAKAYPDALLQTVELDQKIYELCQTHLEFRPTDKTPVAISDGRAFMKRDTARYDWILLDAFRGGYVPAHLKTEEFLRECAARLNEQGVFINNLHEGTELFYADIKTMQKVFAQVVLLNPPSSGNVMAFGVNYKAPIITDPAKWPDPAVVGKRFEGRVDLAAIKRELMPIPREVAAAQVITDDFNPAELLNVIKANNEAKGR
ncbi:MAG: fused MFS/spermidine synthase, partial [Verrucomicrobiota bacterium]